MKQMQRWGLSVLRMAALSLALGLGLTAYGAAPDKSGVKPSVLSLPTGSGSIEGLGESFEPQLNTGTSVYSVKIAVPPGVAGHQPALSLAYNSGNGNGPLGIGWSLDLPRIVRQTDKGVPTFAPGDVDTFLYNGEELVPLEDGTYRCENENEFIRFRPINAQGQPISAANSLAVGWEATLRDGKRMLFGRTPAAKVIHPDKASSVSDNRFVVAYAWAIDSFIDTSGNTIDYAYDRYTDSPGILYPSKITYAHFDTKSHEVDLIYSGSTRYPLQRGDVFSDFRPGFEQRTARLLREVAIYTDNSLVRRYGLGYDPDPALTVIDPKDIPLSFSLLHSVTQYDRSGQDGNYLPPLRFAYTRFHTQSVASSKVALASLATNRPEFRAILGGQNFLRLGSRQTQVMDINADGLPDFIASGDGKWWAYLNQGGGKFSDEVAFQSSQADNKGLDDAALTLADLDGDGMTDLFQKGTAGGRILFHRNLNDFSHPAPLNGQDTLNWGNEEEYTDETGSIDFGELAISSPQLRMMDVNFDKRTDVVRPFSTGGNSGGVEYILNLPADGTHPRRWKSDLVFFPGDPRLPQDWVPDEACFDGHDPTVRRTELADMNGDRLQDWVTLALIGNEVWIDYWPNANGGAFASRQAMDRLEIANGSVDELHLLDVNADGLTDLVRIEHLRLTYWINLGAGHWSQPILRTDAPSDLKDRTVIRQMDVNGNGTTDLVWDNTALSTGELAGMSPVMYFDFVGEQKPNLLQVIDNGIGRRTWIEYKSSTDDYLEALHAGFPWTTKLPFPLQVVKRITVDVGLDLNGDGKVDQYITDISYRDGYYDSFEKEFRGFAFAQKIQRGDDYDPQTGVTSAGTGTVSGPSLVTCHRFLTGGPDGADNDDYPDNYTGASSTDEGSGTGKKLIDGGEDLGGREEEPLKGKPVFVETIDPAVLNAPATEHAGFHEAARATALAAQGNPFSAAAQRCAPDKYVYSRVHTDWKIRRLYRPQAIINPAGRFTTKTLVGKSVSFPFTETTENEIIEAAGLMHELLDGKPVDYPARPKRVTRTVSTFDNYGNQVRDANYGVVEGENVSILNDERIKKTTIALGGEALARWIINRPAVERVEDENGVFVSETRHYYDGEEMKGLALGSVGSRGLEKRAEQVITDDPAKLPALDAYDSARLDRPGDPRLAAGASIVASRTAHDIYGNAIAILDPLGDPADIQLHPSAAAPVSALPAAGNKGHFRVIGYDAQRHTYPVEERIVLGSGKSDLSMQAQYDPGFGVVTRVLDFNANPTDYRYDSFARLVKIIRPGDSLDKPTQAFKYRPADSQRSEVYLYDDAGNLTDGKPQFMSPPVANAVETGLREDISASSTYNTFNTIQYTSGNGQKLMAIEEGETSERWVVKGAARYNLRGTPWATYQPYYRADSAFHLAGSDGIQHDDQPVSDTYRSETRQDATGRTIEAINPPETFGGARTRVISQNLPLESRTFDEEDATPGGRYHKTPLEHLEDGLGRLVEVHEVTRLNDDGTTTSALCSWATRYRYDLDDNLVHLQDSQNNEKWMRYDGLGRRLFMNDPDRGVMTYIYDAASNLGETVDAKGQRVTYTYDGVNRLLTEDYHDEGQPFSFNHIYDPTHPISDTNRPDVAYSYDQPAGEIELGDNTRATATNTKGFLSHIVDLSGEEHNSYDARGRVSWVVKRIPDPVNGVSTSYKTAMTYDALDRTRDLIYPDCDRVSYLYNNRNLPQKITGGAVANLNATPFIVSNYDYLPSGQIKDFTFGNGVNTTYTYDPRLRLRSLLAATTTKPAEPLLSYAYSFDMASNITRINDQRPGSVHPAGDPRRNTQIFSYDDLYRLTGVQYSFNLPGQSDRDDGRIAYRYDRIGNMLAQTSGIDHVEQGRSVTNHGAMSYGAAAGASSRRGRAAGDAPGPHALTATTSGRAYPYDANGNMTDIDGMACTWDFNDRLRFVEDARMRAEYVYDYTDRRIFKKVWAKGSSTAQTVSAPTTTTLYIDKFFEVREHDQPVKYVWNGSTRLSQITSTLESSADRVQRFRVVKGWNLLSLAVQAADAGEQLGIGTNLALRSAWRWEPVGKTYVKLASGDPLPAGSVFWIIAENDLSLQVKGTYTEPSNLSIPAGGSFMASGALEALPLYSVLPATVDRAWIYDSAIEHWRVFFSNSLSSLSDSPTRIAPGQPLFAKVDSQVELVLPQHQVRVQYYLQDHLGSSSSMADGNGNMIEENAFYPFGHPRLHSDIYTSPLSAKYLFSQKEKDTESGLQYFETRYLSSQIGRFTRIDPFAAALPGQWLTTPQRLDQYAYCMNRPIILEDPSGNDAQETQMCSVENKEQNMSRVESNSINFEISSLKSSDKQENKSEISENAGGANIVNYKGSNFTGKKVEAEKGFVKHLEKMNDCAIKNNVKVNVTSSLRRTTKVDNAIVKPAKGGNHLAANAIDANIIVNGKNCNSKCLKSADKPEPVKDFIKCVKEDAEMRWGGDFKTVDSVHFDSGLNVKNQARYLIIINSIK